MSSELMGVEPRVHSAIKLRGLDPFVICYLYLFDIQRLGGTRVGLGGQTSHPPRGGGEVSVTRTALSAPPSSGGLRLKLDSLCSGSASEPNDCNS